MSRDSLTLSCPAKVNLALSVGAQRPEDGLHPIVSWMVAVGFGDTLKLTRSSSGGSSYEILIADDASSSQRIDWPIESDLAFRAHGLMRQHVQQDLPIDMELTKRIPSGAGLGGGSSDAAGMLAGLNALYALGLGGDKLIRLGAKLGSDVGFLVAAQQGVRSAIVSGVGERIEPVQRSGAIHLVLIFPPHRCPTAEVYGCFDRMTVSPRIDPGHVRAVAHAEPLMADAPFNDLCDPAMEVAPELNTIRRAVADATQRPVHLSGSGAAMFVVVQSGQEAESLCNRVARGTGLPAVATQTLM